MAEITFDDFKKFEIRTGTIINVNLNYKAIKPAYKLIIDFGSLGIKISSAQITKNYSPENLIGLQICAVINLSARHIAGVKSEVLVLGVYSQNKDVILLTPVESVEDGSLVG
jgi:export-related chaperone CsaA